jgi:hypothetical protein
LAPPFEIVSLRSAGGDGTWLALLLEGEHLGHFRFAYPHTVDAVEQMRALIHDAARSFARDRSALAQFRELESAHDSRRVVVLAARLAAA